MDLIAEAARLCQKLLADHAEIIKLTWSLACACELELLYQLEKPVNRLYPQINCFCAHDFFRL